MSFRKLALVLALVLVPLAARAEDKEHPYKNAKKGDWIAYKMTTSVMGNNIEGTLKQTVADKDDKSVTIKITGKFMNFDVPPQEQKIDLTKPYDPSKAAPGAENAKVEKVDSGKETLEIGGKKYECEWVKNKIAADVNGMKFESEVKIWLAKSAPLGGMVKMEMKSKQTDMTMEMTDSGTEK
jgi:hypothetical protein